MKRPLDSHEEAAEGPETKVPKLTESGTLSDKPKTEATAGKAKPRKLRKKVVMVVGYNGAEFAGSQKQPSGRVRTVEGELEKGLHSGGFISDSVFGKLQKIQFTRATRTDKKVHALENFFSAKLHLQYGLSLAQHRELLQSHLPKDIKLFALLESHSRFNSHHSCTSREYLYFLPSFCLLPLVSPLSAPSSGSETQACVPSTQSQSQPPPSPSNPSEVTVTPSGEAAVSVASITGTSPSLPSSDTPAPKSAPSPALSITPSDLEAYKCRMSEERVRRLNELCAKYVGTHKFHNYTKGVTAKQGQASRYIMEIRVTETVVVNGIEFLRFFIKGQSFLYNQIRKIIGMLVLIYRKQLPTEIIDNSFQSNVFVTPLAPGNGLLLRRVCYDKHREAYQPTKAGHVPDPEQEEINAFAHELINEIGLQEAQQHVPPTFVSFC